MIKLNEADIYTALMTSDFQDGWSNTELIEFIIKFRYHYRMSQARLEQKNKDFENLKKTYDNNITIAEEKIQNLQKDNISLHERIAAARNRKLTLKERLKGKLIDYDE